MKNDKLMNLIIGFVAGLAIGLIVLLLFGGSDAGEFKKMIADQKTQIANQAEKIKTLRHQKEAQQAQRREAVKDVKYLTSRMGDLQQEIDLANEMIAGLRIELEEFALQPAGPETRRQGEVKPAVKRELTELEKEASERYSHVIIVGEPLTQEAIKELGLDRAGAARINDMLKDEGERARKAIARFYREHLPDPPENLEKLSTRDLIWGILPHVARELKWTSRLTAEEQLKLYKGETDVFDYMPRDSKLLKFCYTLHDVRQETYRKLEPELPPDKMNILTEKYLPPDDFVFPDDMGFPFGEIDWDKERK